MNSGLPRNQPHLAHTLVFCHGVPDARCKRERIGLSHIPPTCMLWYKASACAAWPCLPCTFLQVFTWRFKKGVWDLRAIVQPGGMPSSHSSLCAVSEPSRAAWRSLCLPWLLNTCQLQNCLAANMACTAPKGLPGHVRPPLQRF